jgi:hypothetical protein
MEKTVGLHLKRLLKRPKIVEKTKEPLSALDEPGYKSRAIPG